MILEFWIKTSLRVEPHSSKLWKGILVFSIFTSLMLILYFNYVDYKKAIFPVLWLSLVGLFWCIGLLSMLRVFLRLPDRQTYNPSTYFVLIGFSYIYSFFLVIWFLGLLFMTFVAPISMLISNNV